MPGIDYRRLRASIPMEQVLQLIGFELAAPPGNQLRGGCPLPTCQATESRLFSVDLGRGLFRCFACGLGGNQLDLWALMHDLQLYEAAHHLCHQTHTPIPWITSVKP